MSLPDPSHFVQLQTTAIGLAKEALARWACGHPELAYSANRALVLFDSNAIRDYSDDFSGDTFIVADENAPDGYFLCAREWCTCDPMSEASICQHSLAVCLLIGYRSHFATLYRQARAKEASEAWHQEISPEEIHLPVCKGRNNLTCTHCHKNTPLEISSTEEALSYVIECPHCLCEFEVEILQASEPNEPQEEPISPSGKGTFPIYTPLPIPAPETPKEEPSASQRPPANPFKNVSRWRWQGGRLPRPRISEDQDKLGELCIVLHGRNHCAAQLAGLGSSVLRN